MKLDSNSEAVSTPTPRTVITLQTRGPSGSQLSENDYLNLSREFDTQAPPIVARFTDAIGKILRPKVSEMLRTNPIQPDIAIAAGQVQSADGAEEPLAPIAELR